MNTTTKPFRSKLVLLGLAPVIMLATGCVSGKQFRSTKAERDYYKSLAKQNETTATAARAEAQVYRSQLSASARDHRAKDEAINGLTLEMVKMQSDFDRLTADYQAQMDAKNQPLDDSLNEELAAFAKANADLLTYDAERGLVKFKSDVTFSAGSADMTKDAATAVVKLARILNSSGARSYDLMVAGHTDSRPVSRQSTIAKGHKDNWYLSSHRAISVSDVMRKAGVAKERMAVVGYADQRPTSTNATAEGRATNRRVEVIIMPAGSSQNGQFARLNSAIDTVTAAVKSSWDLWSTDPETAGIPQPQMTKAPAAADSAPSPEPAEASVDFTLFDK